MTVTIKGRTFTAEQAHSDGPLGDYWILTGKRGATYITIRNIHSGHMGIVSRSSMYDAFPGVWLTDANGTLEVL